MPEAQRAGGRDAWHDARSAQTCRFCGGGQLVAAGAVKGFRFLECRECAFAFTPEVRAETAREYYSSADETRGAPPHQGWAGLEFLAPALDAVETGRPLMMMDFGTGQSTVPDRLRERGHRVLAIDLTPPSRPHPDRLTGDVLHLPLPESSFDLIFSFQVFEHLAEPRPVFDRLLSLLRPGGCVAIHTDMEVEDRPPALADWWYVMPPNHCSFYRHRSFERVLQGTDCGLVHADPKLVVIRRT